MTAAESNRAGNARDAGSRIVTGNITVRQIPGRDNRWYNTRYRDYAEQAETDKKIPEFFMINPFDEEQNEQECRVPAGAAYNT